MLNSASFLSMWSKSVIAYVLVCAGSEYTSRSVMAFVLVL